MRYYEVLVGDLHYHGDTALTYEWDSEIALGSVVQIELRNRKVLGVVDREVSKPDFTAKPLLAVADFPPLPPEHLKLMHWLSTYYPAPFGAIVRQFLPPAVPFPKKISASKKSKLHTAELPALTPAQAKAFASIQDNGYNLLHGITGSGKTRLYLEKTIDVVHNGKSAIILTPEIGLTTQLSETFTRVFGSAVFVLHSRQTAAQRRNDWYRILASTEPIIVIGPRSALFAPVKNIGLIVVDESHDQAYKNESAPHYRAERVAAVLGNLHGACVISGSATPNIEEYYLALAKKRPVISLTSIAKGLSEEHKLNTKIIDMRDESNRTKSSMFSSPLIAELQQCLQSHSQALLFLNRRGTAAAILCNACGWRALCSHCDLPLTYHGDAHTLRCHTCGRTSGLPTSCPDCGNTDIVLRSIGTKAVAAEVERLFPQARVRRFDSDTTKADQLESQLDSLAAGEVDIIIGTQMITKGLDLPKLSLVGILNADSSLLMPDFTATERTYQLISQAAGRVGRGHSDSSIVVVQSYNPTQTVLKSAVESEWDGYYTSEITERKQFSFPPFVHLLKLTCTRASSDKAEAAALEFKQVLADTYTGIAVDGPSPGFHPRENGRYKWQLVVKAKQRQSLIAIINALPSGWSYDIDPANLL